MAFTDILNLSICASWLVLAVISVRLVLKKAPKALHCALWALVAIRLLCPVSIESAVSLIPSREVVSHDYLVMEPGHEEFTQSASLDIITNPVYDTTVSIEIEPTADRIQHWDMIGTVLWLTGAAAMMIYAVYSYLLLRLRVRMAAWVRGRIWECDDLDSPFILGLLHPRIYLPSDLDEATRANVIAHERAHLKRLDHLWKPLGFCLLAIHWFNPIMWLAYALLCRDIELACDERVIRSLDKCAVHAYSESLIRCSVTHRSMALCPVAFGEVGIKSRITAMTRYKKPGVVLTAAALAVSLMLALCFLTDPATVAPDIEAFLSREDCRIHSLTGKSITLDIHRSDLPDNVLNGRKHRFQDSAPLLLEHGDTCLYLSEAAMRDNELILTITFEHEPGDSGTLLLPYNPNAINSNTSVHMGYWDTAESDAVLAGTIRIQETDKDSISVAIQTDRWNRTKDSLQFQIEGLIRLEYSLEPQQFFVNNLHYRTDELQAFTAPEFQLNSDGTFTMVPNAFSSYHGHGIYTLDHAALTMKTEDGYYTWVFTAGDGAFVYDRARSSSIQYYIDARTAADLPDGTRFVLTDPNSDADEVPAVPETTAPAETVPL